MATVEAKTNCINTIYKFTETAAMAKILPFIILIYAIKYLISSALLWFRIALYHLICFDNQMINNFRGIFQNVYAK